MAEVTWIKLSTSIFENRKIKQIECLPDGASIILIWLKLLCLAGSVNDNGFIYFTKRIPYNEQMLATQFNVPVNTMHLALQTFESFGMLENIDGIISIVNWEKYQNVEGMDKIREQNRIRKQRQRQRENEKLLLCDSHAMSRDCHATEEDKEEDKDIDKNKNNKGIYVQIVDLFHALCPSYPAIRSLSDARKKALSARLNQYSVDDFENLFKKAEASDFLKGANNRNWQANFDWLIKDANMAKVLDGNYDNKKKNNSQKSADGLDGFYKMAAEWAEGD